MKRFVVALLGLGLAAATVVGEPNAASSAPTPVDLGSATELVLTRGRVEIAESVEEAPIKEENPDLRVMASVELLEFDSSAIFERQGDQVTLELLDGESMRLDFLPADEHGFGEGFEVALVNGQAPVAAFTLVDDEVLAQIPDFAHGRDWSIVPAERIMVAEDVRNLTVFPDDDYDPVLAEARQIPPVEPPTFDGEPIPSFGPEDDLPSSVPEGDVITDGDSPAPEGDVEIPPTRRNRRVWTGGFEVIDVAMLATGRASLSWAELEASGASTAMGANSAALNSGLPTRFRIVGVEDSNANTSTTDLSTDAVMDQIQGEPVATTLSGTVLSLRQSTKADLVVVIIGPDDFEDGKLGKAGGIPGPEDPNSSYGFVAIDVAHRNVQLTLAHEIGHVVGGAHALGGGGESYAHGYGFVHNTNSSIRYETVMGGDFYPPSTPTQRPLIFSDPGRQYAGRWTGTSTRDNQRAINKWDDNIGDLDRGHYCPFHGTGYTTWVNDRYADMVGQGPSTGVRNLVVNRLADGRSGSSRYSTTEATLAFASQATVVNDLSRAYKSVLNRFPDHAGHEYWTGRRHTDLSLESVIANFLASSEGTSLHGSRTDANFVLWLYQRALGRNGTTSERQGWVNLIPTHGRAWVAANISQSAEAKAHNRWRDELIGLYYGLLDRSPDTTGYNYWINIIDDNKWFVTRYFMDTNEYWAQC